MTIECVRYKEINKGNLLGFADIYIPKWGVEISGFTHNQKGNQEWVNMPSKEFVTPEGAKMYAPIVKFRDKQHQAAFLDACKTAIHDRPKDRVQMQGELF